MPCRLEFLCVFIITLAASRGKRNVIVWRPSVGLLVCLSVCLSHLFNRNKERGTCASAQRNSPGGSTRRGQSTYPSGYYEDGLLLYLSCYIILYYVTLHNIMLYVALYYFLMCSCVVLCRLNMLRVTLRYFTLHYSVRYTAYIS